MHMKTLSKESGQLVQGYGVKYHPQEFHGSDQYCGAASAQMILESIGRGLLDQTCLLNCIAELSEVDPIENWHSAPDGLVSALNACKPERFLDPFELLEFGTESETSQAVCWGIESGVAPIVLLSGGSHWVVIAGYTASRAPIALTDDNYDIFTFEVFDPAEGIRSIQYAAPAEADARVSRRYWRDHFTPVELGAWTDEYLVICHLNPPDPI
jgi:hypothetical protein